MLQPPVLDFGTGDGSFAAALFDHVAFGVDNDPDALRVAAQFGVYGTLVQGTHDRIPVADGVARSAFSNSVLEHVVDLRAVLAELRRVLCPDGMLIFTVPVPQYTSDLRRYFGRRAADRINAESIHRNLHTATEWQALLATAGFRVQESRSYQPGVVTFWYRMLRLLGPRGLGRLAPGLSRQIWNWSRTRLVELVRRSIHGTETGGNVLIVAR